jgi:hypothetical protein
MEAAMSMRTIRDLDIRIRATARPPMVARVKATIEMTMVSLTPSRNRSMLSQMKSKSMLVWPIVITAPP